MVANGVIKARKINYYSNINSNNHVSNTFLSVPPITFDTSANISFVATPASLSRLRDAPTEVCTVAGEVAVNKIGSWNIENLSENNNKILIREPIETPAIVLTDIENQILALGPLLNTYEYLDLRCSNERNTDGTVLQRTLSLVDIRDGHTVANSALDSNGLFVQLAKSVDLNTSLPSTERTRINLILGDIQVDYNVNQLSTARREMSWEEAHDSLSHPLDRVL